jgi:hypothetical protein
MAAFAPPVLLDDDRDIQSRQRPDIRDQPALGPQDHHLLERGRKRGRDLHHPGVEVAQELLTEAQGAVLPLVPYLDSLRWLFIALALAGIAVAVWARVDDWKKGLR